MFLVNNKSNAVNTMIVSSTSTLMPLKATLKAHRATFFNRSRVCISLAFIYYSPTLGLNTSGATNLLIRDLPKSITTGANADKIVIGSII